MSYWNYRVIRKRYPESDAISYQIHEVYYADNGSIEHWTEDPVQPFGETAEELREGIRFFLQAFRRPILECTEVDGDWALMTDEDHSPINEGHYFELMDRASVAVDYVYQFVGSHPLLKRETRLREIYERAEQALAELYREAGRAEFERMNGRRDA
ncbi:MAG: hypothetical protein ACT4QB_17110 [Gammaproteobacteria bacterium]